MTGPPTNKFLVRLNRKTLYVLGALAGLAAVGAFVFFILDAVFWHPDIPVPNHTVLPKVEDQSLIPTELDQTLEIFGPWEPLNVGGGREVANDPRRLLLLKENGGVRVSAWGIQLLDSEWSNFIPPEISGLTMEREVAHFRTNKNREFRVNVSQPFILEQTSLMVYFISHEGKIWGIPLSKAETLRYKIR